MFQNCLTASTLLAASKSQRRRGLSRVFGKANLWDNVRYLLPSGGQKYIICPHISTWGDLPPTT